MITLDSNILVYVYDDGEAARQTAAARIVEILIRSEAGPVGLQVIGELHSALRRKLKLPAWEAAEAGRSALAAFERTFGSTEQAVQDALAFASAGRLSYWDGLLVASARDAGCTVMLSEDMAPGRVLSVEIVKPFDAAGVLTARARDLLAL